MTRRRMIRESRGTKPRVTLRILWLSQTAMPTSDPVSEAL
jgi:hypothetical protein